MWLLRPFHALVEAIRDDPEDFIWSVIIGGALIVLSVAAYIREDRDEELRVKTHVTVTMSITTPPSHAPVAPDAGHAPCTETRP